MLSTRKDCFAYTGRGCHALTNLFCARGECPFYKTGEQAKRDKEAAERLYFQKTGETAMQYQNRKKQEERQAQLKASREKEAQRKRDKRAAEKQKNAVIKGAV